jgi:hypothetical protein
MNSLKLLGLLVALALPAKAANPAYNASNLGERGTCEFSTAFKNPADGIIGIDWVCATSTNPAGGYVAIYDATAVTNATLGVNSEQFVTAVSAKVLSGTTDCAKQSCEKFDPPLPIRKGLVFGNSHADMRTSVGYTVLRRQ